MKVVAEEELLKADSKGDNQEAELLILDEFAVLCRDLYAFYPMLIRYVDNNRYKWANKYKISGASFILPELYDSNLTFPCPVPGPGGLRSQTQTPLSSSGWWQKSSSCGANPTLVSNQPSIPSSQPGQWFCDFIALSCGCRISSVRSKTLWCRMRSTTWASWLERPRQRCPR